MPGQIENQIKSETEPTYLLVPAHAAKSTVTCQICVYCVANTLSNIPIQSPHMASTVWVMNCAIQD